MSQPLILLIALIAGFVGGIVLRAIGQPALAAGVDYIVLVGEIWLRALQMTSLPLLIALLITGIAGAGDVAASGRIAGRSLTWIVLLVVGAGLLGTTVILGFLALWPVGDEARTALIAE